MSKFDRFSLGVVFRDYWYSLTIFGSERVDVSARRVITWIPVAVAGVAFWREVSLAGVTTLLPAVSLMSAGLLFVAGQVISLRDKIKEPEDRIRRHFRETISGLLISALACVLLGVLLAILGVVNSAFHPWVVRVISSAACGVGAYLAIMFAASARRLYASYLEAYEGGMELDPPAGHKSLVRRLLRQ